MFLGIAYSILYILIMIKIMDYTKKSILSVDDFSKEEIFSLFELTSKYKADGSSVDRFSKGKILLTAFFEVSTRTRLSFESAALRNDMKVLSIVDPMYTSIAKGESLEDIGHMLNSYADVVVIRHGNFKSYESLRSSISIPLINAGNGSQEHPTQALTDWFTLGEWCPALVYGSLTAGKKIHLGIVGIPSQMRSVNSFLLMARHFIDNIDTITIVTEYKDISFVLSEEVASVMSAYKDKIKITSDFEGKIALFDAIYINSIAYLDDDYQRLGASYRILFSSMLKKGSAVFHPLARQSELSTEIDNTPNNYYFQQAKNAVFVRQAILENIFS